MLKKMKKNDFLSFGAGLAIRFANLVGGGIEASGIRLVDLSEESILREARRRTKLQNWGNERFQVPLRAIIEGHENDSNLTFVGRFIARQMLIHMVSNRLRIHNDLEKHPEILNGEIRRPLFVTGLPRSGTTLLYNMLAQDPGGRPLLYWEAFSPSPPPCPQTYDCDPRIKVAERSIATLYRALPSLKLIHEINPRGPAEDLLLLINTFVTPSLQGELPKYRKWLDEVGDEVLIASYKEYREQLLLLQWKVSKDHWVLKSPSHLFGLKALLEVFPDACVVQTHRDPAEAISSLLSLAVTISSLSVKTIKQKMLKEIIVKMLEQQLQRSMDARRGRMATEYTMFATKR